ncbi:hypothetical protein [Burkholderia multivorans]|uniref:hypothetical protein n=1 Tax=Burkholderia multivorans TaxID=87883 RepID=UPI000759BE12|nr:hypothetical protein [Burkholderia multivorans]KVR44956.1 hypothetical protein WK17_11505 [Burkholderia multivorans]
MATRRLNDDGVLIRTRTRAPYQLLRFDSEAALDVEAACFDRLELTREYLLSGVPWNYDAPRDLVLTVGQERRSAASQHALDSRCNAFRFVSEGNGEGRLRLKLGDTIDGARWLIELSIEFRVANRTRASGMETAGGPPVLLKLKTAMSPTRLAAHAWTRSVSPTCNDWRELLVSDTATYREIADTSVSMTHDNLLPVRFLQPVALDRMIDETRRFLVAIDRLVEHLIGVEIRPDRPAVGAWLAESARRWTIRQAETYWEFGHVHAIEFVRQLRPTLWALGNDVRERAWGLEDRSETIAFTARLTDSLRAAIYPKTVDRVRLEVRHSKSVPGNNSEDIGTRLRRIAEDAVGRANRARRAIAERLRAAAGEASAAPLDALCDLVTMLQNCYGNRSDRAGDILRLLLSRGGIRCREDDFPVSKSEAQMLKNRGIVTTSPLARHSTTGDLMYSIAARYQLLFELFSELGNERREAP